MKNFGKFVALLFWAVGMAIINGLCFKQLWLWYIVPLGMTPLTIPMALGVMLIVSMLTADKYMQIFMGEWKKDIEKFEFKKYVLLSIWWPASLFFGWIYTLFM